MRVVDTVVLLAYLDKNDLRHLKAMEYVFDIGLGDGLFVPSATMHELGMELKTHGIHSDQRKVAYSRLTRLLPQGRILPSVPSVFRRAAELSQEATWRDSYFDTLIAATGLEYGADSVVTTDRKFAKLGLKPVF